jgi:hypothetical protein
VICSETLSQNENYKGKGARNQRLMPVMLAIQEAEIKDLSSGLGQANISQDPHLQNNQRKMDWRCG